MRTSMLVAMALLGVTATPALAGGGPGTVAADAPVEAAPVKAPKVAGALAVGGTVLGWGLFVGGIAMIDSDPDSAVTSVGRGSTIAGLALATIGPSAGHIYAGEGAHALVTSAARAAGGAMIVVGALMADPIDICFGEPCDRDDGNDAGWVIAGVGAALIVGTTIYDVVDAPRAARRANRRAARAVVVPVAMGGGDSVVPGLVVAGQF